MNFKKMLLLILLLIISYSGYSQYEKSNMPTISGYAISKINPFRGPLQSMISNPERARFSIVADKETFTATPAANYDISATVASKNNFYFDWDAKLSPVDLILVWGELANKNNEKYVTFSQDKRLYSANVTNGSPIPLNYVYRHSSNNHVIPATENVSKALRMLKKGDVVTLNGYLIFLKSTQTDKYWYTSVTRDDIGAGASELFYVTRVRIGDAYYM